MLWSRRSRHSNRGNALAGGHPEADGIIRPGFVSWLAPVYPPDSVDPAGQRTVLVGWWAGAERNGLCAAPGSVPDALGTRCAPFAAWVGVPGPRESPPPPVGEKVL